MMMMMILMMMIVCVWIFLFFEQHLTEVWRSVLLSSSVFFCFCFFVCACVCEESVVFLL